MEIEKTYDGMDLPQGALDLTLRCRNCGDEDTLVENTRVPRSMGASLYRDQDGQYYANLETGADEAFWEAETDPTWGCSNCVSENEDLFALFEVLPDDAD